MLTQKRLKKILDYNFITGIFKWKVQHHRNAVINKNAVGRQGTYLAIKINKIAYAAHDLAWLYIWGQFPKQQIDHINRIKHCNTIHNLQDIYHLDNSKNRNKPINNTSGITGVSWNKATNKWRAQIKLNNENLYLGSFINKLDAVNARQKAEKLYGFNYK